jgi:alpha-L-arabinofuranosidase
MKTMRYLHRATAALLLLTACTASRAQVTIDVHADHVVGRASPYLTGACIEDVNHEVYGGVYSQMIYGESFQEPAASGAGVSGMWKPVGTGTAEGRFSLTTDHPFVGAQSQQITFARGQGSVGIENRGLNHWGLSFVAGKPYEGHVWLRCDRATPVYVTAESADGMRTYAETKIDAQPGDWQRSDFTLAPSSTDPNARFSIRLKEPGSVTVGYVFLQPGEWGRFKGLPVRKDVAEALIAEGLTVMRYGGSMINDPQYRWKKMIGPRDRRPPYKGTWYPYSSNGFGIIDFLRFCEAAGFVAIPDLDNNESPQDIADFIEYVNGPGDSPWGRRRADDGHPAPFGLKYIELGNEEAVDEVYWQKFKPLAEAIWSKDPSVTPVVGDFAYGKPITDPYHFTGAPRIKTLAAHKKILDFAREQRHAVWFDVHLNNDRPREPGPQIDVLAQFIDWLGKLSPGADYKVCVFEENANNHTFRRALAHARTVDGLMRLGADRVPIVCCANCLQCDAQNDNGWDQGLLFLNPSQVWPQSPYYVTQMIARHALPRLVQATVSNDATGSIDVVARASDDGRTLALQVTNLSDRPQPGTLRLAGFAPSGPAELTELTARLDAVNTAADPHRVVPTQRPWPAEFHDGAASYTFPPHSFTIIGWQR